MKSSPKLFKLSLAALLVYSFTATTFAAKFITSHDANGARVNDTIHATVYLDTEGQTINNGEAAISFPKDKLRVESVSISGSIFNLWVEQPTFSNQSGIISFNGGVPNPGYIGARGRILQITYRAIGTGDGVFTFSNQSILANDGYGTDVANSSSPSSFAIASPTPEEPEKIITTPVETPVKNESSTIVFSTPVITSKEIPNSTNWYNVSSATFSWNLPAGTKSVLTSLDSSIDGVPTKEYTPAISSRTLTDLDDGKQYLHIRFIGNGSRSSIGTYGINIDTSSPTNLTLKKETSESAVYKLLISATDKTSGISHYTLSIDDGTPEKITISNDIKSTEYLLPALAAGNHTITVVAYDKANNSIEEKLSFSAEPLRTPILSTQTQSIKSGKDVSISGTTGYSNSLVRVWFKEDGKEAKSTDITSDASGNFNYTYRNTEADNLIEIYAETVLDENTRSTPSNKLVITVEESGNLLLILTLVALFLLAVAYICHMQLELWKLKAEKNLDLSTVDINEELGMISTTIKEYVKMLRTVTKKQRITHGEEIEILSLFNRLSKSHADLAKKLRRGKL